MHTFMGAASPSSLKLSPLGAGYFSCTKDELTHGEVVIFVGCCWCCSGDKWLRPEDGADDLPDQGISGGFEESKLNP